MASLIARPNKITPTMQPESRVPDALLDFPDFAPGFPYHYHDDLDEFKANAQAYTLEKWPFASEDQKKYFTAMAVEDWAALLSYGAPKHRAEVFAVWCNLYALYDDYIDSRSIADAEIVTTRMHEILLGDEVLEDLTAVEWVANDVARMIRDCETSSGNVQGMKDMTKLFLERTWDYVQAAGSKKARKACVQGDIEAYFEYRSPDVGVVCSTVGQLWARELVVPAHLFSNEDVRPLLRSFIRQQISVNDLFSYRRERQVHDLQRSSDATNDGYTWCSSMYVFVTHHHMSPSQAMEEVKRLVRHYEHQFVEILEKLRAKYSGSPDEMAGIEAMAGGMMDLMGGTTHWYQYTGRYNDTTECV